jgi:hypothetical protein
MKCFYAVLVTKLVECCWFVVVVVVVVPATVFLTLINIIFGFAIVGFFVGCRGLQGFYQLQGASSPLCLLEPKVIIL